MLLAWLVIITKMKHPAEVETLVNRVWLLNSSFFLINLLIAIGFLRKGPLYQIANPAATTLFYIGVMLLERLSPYKLKNYLRGLIFITLISHSLIGEYYRAYYMTTDFDSALHFLGTFTFALFTYELLVTYVKISSSHPSLLAFLLVALLGVSLGTLFELIEFSLDLLFNAKTQYSLIDTDFDLLFDLLGAILAGVFTVTQSR